MAVFIICQCYRNLLFRCIIDVASGRPRNNFFHGISILCISRICIILIQIVKISITNSAEIDISVIIRNNRRDLVCLIICQLKRERMSRRSRTVQSFCKGDRNLCRKRCIFRNNRIYIEAAVGDGDIHILIVCCCFSKDRLYLSGIFFICQTGKNSRIRIGNSLSLTVIAVILCNSNAGNCRSCRYVKIRDRGRIKSIDKYSFSSCQRYCIIRIGLYLRI